MFNKGDRVVRLFCSNGSRVPVGTLGIVDATQVYEHVVCVVWDGLDGDKEDSSYVNRAEYVHLLGVPVEDEEKLKKMSKVDDAKPTNPKDAASADRLDLSLFPQTAIAYGAVAMTEGHLKYGGYNYRSAGVNVSVYVSALMRHLFKFYNGEWEDQKTGVPHLASILACAAILVDGFVVGNINDDRPPSVNIDTLFAQCKEQVKDLKDLFRDCPGRHTETGEVAKMVEQDKISNIDDEVTF